MFFHHKHNKFFMLRIIKFKIKYCYILVKGYVYMPEVVIDDDEASHCPSNSKASDVMILLLIIGQM